MACLMLQATSISSTSVVLFALIVPWRVPDATEPRQPSRLMPAIPSRLHIIAWFAVTSLTVWSWRTAPTPRQGDGAGSGISLNKGRVYRTVGSRRATLDVYLPARTSNTSDTERLRPAVLALHGGSWIGGSMTAFRYDARNTVIRLAQQGLVVFALDYRLARPGSPSWPAVVGDLREAVRWVRRHSGEFGIDPGRIAVLGQSSGGHLAALLATLPEERGPDGVSSRVQAVVSFYGPSDLADLIAFRRLAHEPARIFVGEAAVRPVDHAVAASPIRHVTKTIRRCSFFMARTTPGCLSIQSVRMAAALAAPAFRTD